MKSTSMCIQHKLKIVKILKFTNIARFVQFCGYQHYNQSHCYVLCIAITTRISNQEWWLMVVRLPLSLNITIWVTIKWMHSWSRNAFKPVTYIISIDTESWKLEAESTYALTKQYFILTLNDTLRSNNSFQIEYFPFAELDLMHFCLFIIPHNYTATHNHTPIHTDVTVVVRMTINKMCAFFHQFNAHVKQETVFIGFILISSFHFLVQFVKLTSINVLCSL